MVAAIVLFASTFPGHTPFVGLQLFCTILAGGMVVAGVTYPHSAGVKPLILRLALGTSAGVSVSVLGLFWSADTRLVGGGGIFAAGAAIALANENLTDRVSKIATAGFVLAIVLALLLTLRHAVLIIDIQVFMIEGARDLVHGVNPYSAWYPNVYDAATTQLVQGPGVVVDGWVTSGFPYPPVSLLAHLPGALLGDPRTMAVALVAAVCFTLVVLGDRRSRLVAIALISSPATLFALYATTTEPVQVALVLFAALAVTRRRLMFAAVIFGLVLATKQYFFLALPCFWLLRGTFERRHLFACLATAVAAYLPFFLWDPRAMYHALVEYQMIQPLREDSLSFLVLAMEYLGWPRASLYGAIPLAVGIVVAGLLVWKLRRGPSSFLIALSLSLLCMVLTSKQAFMNYFFMVGGLWLAAALVEGRTGFQNDKSINQEASEQLLPGEVPQVGDVRREAGVHP